MAKALTVPQGAALKIFNYTICPYCCKVYALACYSTRVSRNFVFVMFTKTKALLRFLGVAYSPVEVSPLTKSQISWSKDYRKVPIVVFDDGLVVNGSDAIVDELLARFTPPESFQNPASQKWAAWATNELAVYMYPNMTRSFNECRAALAYVDSSPFGWVESIMIKNIGAFGMSMGKCAVHPPLAVVYRTAFDQVHATQRMGKLKKSTELKTNAQRSGAN